MFNNVVCPYCLRTLSRSDLKMTCPTCGTEVISNELFSKKSPKCTKQGCYDFASKKTCRKCNTELPSDIMDYKKYLRFSILGTTGSGKSNFLTTMLHELRNSINSPWVISPMNNLTSTIFQDNDRALYEMRQPVEANIPGASPPPLLWRIKDRGRMTRNDIPSYSMTIFDGAGEDCENIDPVISRYIGGSKVLVIVIDPLSLPGIAKNISPDVLSWSIKVSHSEGASANMVDGLTNYIRESCQISPGRLINRDVAVVFTKIDAVKDSFGSAATVMRPSPHLAANGFDKKDADHVNVEIKDWLARNGETAFLNAIETNFRKERVRFFGVSSFGQPPIGADRLGQIMPHRVLDPLIWMLSKEKIASII